MAKFGRTENHSPPQHKKFAKVEKEIYSVFVSSCRSSKDIEREREREGEESVRNF